MLNLHSSAGPKSTLRIYVNTNKLKFHFCRMGHSQDILGAKKTTLLKTAVNSEPEEFRGENTCCLTGSRTGNKHLLLLPSLPTELLDSRRNNSSHPSVN